MNFELTPELLSLQQRTREFIAAQVIPLEKDRISLRWWPPTTRAGRVS